LREDLEAPWKFHAPGPTRRDGGSLVSEISERYRRLSEQFAQKVAAVPDNAWDNQSPCEEWTARDVVNHVVQTPGMFFGMVGAEHPETPSVDEDPVAAFDASRDVMQRALDDPQFATQEFDGFFGRTTFEAAVDRFVGFDLVVHGWDLARATGLDQTMDPSEVGRLTEQMAQFGDAARAPGVFGPEVEVPPDADAQSKLLGLTGRNP
jgi:uncharacterized protein (TIGR03086 family)